MIQVYGRTLYDAQLPQVTVLHEELSYRRSPTVVIDIGMMRSHFILPALAVLLAIGVATTSRAEYPEILGATAERSGMGWRINVTLQHPDTGWDHFADGWDVQDGDGNMIGYRELMHPHVEEQPFTRSLVNVMLPDGTREVYIRARCSIAGWSSELYKIKLEN